MVTFQTIVCAVDFSDQSRVALIRAAGWARRFGARLTVVTVVEPLLANAAAAAYDMDLAREEVLPELRTFVEKVAADGTLLPEWQAVVLTGEPADQIVGHQPADLIVIATQGLSGYRKLLLGSTTERVLRQTRVPVLVVPPGEQTADIRDATLQVGRVLMPVDFDSACVTDAQAAADIAQALDVPLLLLHIVEPVRGLDRLRSALETHNRIQGELAAQQMQRLAAGIIGVDIETSIASGAPAEEIARIAVERGAGLIVMGLRRQTRLFGARPGAIAYRVLGLAPAMILALPSQAVSA